MSVTTITQNEQANAELDLSVSESAQLIKSVTPKHPALSRLHTDLKSAGGTSTITSYDRMHHRHNPS